MPKLILIPGRVFDDDYYGVRVSYAEYFSKWGNVLPVPVWPELDYEPLLKQASMVVYPGGADINPRKYQHVPSLLCQKVDPVAEYFDEVFLPKAIEMGIPIFGVCRGLQAINVHFGGTLKQDLPQHPHSDTWDQTVHKVHLTYLMDKKVKAMEVNSLHHQGIDELAEPLEQIGYSDDFLIEAIYHPNKPIVAVQWHPEVLPYNNFIDSWISKILK
jgi:putative glutamine amidotransferase